VEPGQVARLTPGGTGRPVIGRVLLPDRLKEIAGKRVGGSLSSRLETPGRPEGRTAEDGRRREEEETNRSRFFNFTPQPDGSFRLPDVPPGDYEAMAYCQEELGEGQSRESRMAGMVRRAITVPEILGGKAYSEEPFDIGALTLEPVLAVGQPAPEIRATTLDGKPVRLSDFKGKSVLVVFWSPHQQGGQAESGAVRSLLKYKSFTSGDRLVILGVCIDAALPEAVRTAISQRGWDWRNAVEEVSRDEAGADMDDSLRRRYDLPYRPSVWLLGPDGEIVGRDLRGDAIKAAAARALRAK
jgi:hypothetical protein